jgi:exosome complex component CSL4
VRPGDIVLARVLSFGDTNTSFLLSTAEDQLGVVSAIGDNGQRMIPASWTTVKAVNDAQVTEPRKVAQVPNLNL